MKHLLFSLITVSLLGSNLNGMEKSIEAPHQSATSESIAEQLEVTPDSNPKPLISEEQIANFTGGVGQGYISLLGMMIVHELGHKLAYTLLTGKSASIDITIFPPNAITIPHNLNPNEIDGWKGASLALAGPLFGTCAALSSLKLANIINEKLKGKSTKEAIIAGLKKPFFNREQPLWLRIVSGFNLYWQVENTVPAKIGYMGNDGYRALEAIGKPFAVNDAIAKLFRK